MKDYRHVYFKNEDNLSEHQIRQLERIEENFLRKVFKTPKSCPIIQLYLESGHTPARFEIQRMRLLYLQNIHF